MLSIRKDYLLSYCTYLTQCGNMHSKSNITFHIVRKRIQDSRFIYKEQVPIFDKLALSKKFCTAGHLNILLSRVQMYFV